MKTALYVGFAAGCSAIVGGVFNLSWVIAPSAVVLLLVIVALPWIEPTESGVGDRSR
ncbi:hypothetical protein BH23GEM9_BH23GEM9_17680 [soil metagenome]